MREWWLGRTASERLLLGSGAVVLTLLMIYAFVISPFYSSYDDLQVKVDAQRNNAAWMEQNSQTLQQLRRAGGGAGRGLGGKSLLATADSTARAGGLAGSLKRVEPEGNNVRVWLEGASFDLVVKWLVQLSTTYGIETDSVSMERVSDSAGRVNARLTLQAPSS